MVSLYETFSCTLCGGIRIGWRKDAGFGTGLVQLAIAIDLFNNMTASTSTSCSKSGKDGFDSNLVCADVNEPFDAPVLLS